MLSKIHSSLNKLANLVGLICAFLLVLTVLNVIFDVVMRYFFNIGFIGMQELEWHLFSMMFLLGIAYALNSDGHVRVDFLHEKFSSTLKAYIDFFGAILLIIPLSWLIFYYGIAFTVEAFKSGEKSGDPGGLYYRWLLKSFIAGGFLLTILMAINMAIYNLNIIIHSVGSEKTRKWLCFPIVDRNSTEEI